MKIDELTADEAVQLAYLQEKRQTALDAETALAGRIDHMLGGYQGRRVIRVWAQLKALMEGAE